MKIPALLFRFRFLLHAFIFLLGFWAPWNRFVPLDHSGPNAHVWGLLAANLAQLGLGSISTVFNLLLGLAILFALAAAGLRTWGSAYIGANIVNSASMHTAGTGADGILRDGPFAHVRNPLYLGIFLHTLALTLLMPRSGAIFAVVAIALMELALILAEESFLTARLGAPYLAYCALVPRLWPALRAKVAPTGIKPRWTHAFLGELYFWGAALSFGILGWRSNALLLMQCLGVSLGVSLVARGLFVKPA